ncbi:tubulin binding cofactor A [Trametopsis cervina]|nr:tubulin binding cofactor A [Trametopsis cervina]
MSDSATLIRQIKIKSGSTKRLFKEHKSYVVEEEQQKIKLDKFIANGAEEWDIKNARKMLEESGKMIQDSTKRLGTAVQDLRQLLVSAEKNPDIAKNEEVLKAEEVLEEVSV